MRQRTQRRITAVSAVVATTLVVTAVSWTSGGTASAAPAGKSTGRTAVVTLVTGDRVTLLPGGQLSVKPAKGREKMGFVTRTDSGHSYVIPADALRLFSTGKLDPRLFDVKGLVADGYDDAHRADTPLILQYDKNARTAQPTIAGARSANS